MTEEAKKIAELTEQVGMWKGLADFTGLMADDLQEQLNVANNVNGKLRRFIFVETIALGTVYIAYRAYKKSYLKLISKEKEDEGES